MLRRVKLKKGRKEEEKSVPGQETNTTHRHDWGKHPESELRAQTS